MEMNVICFLILRQVLSKLDTNNFIIFELSHFIYGITIYVINKNTLKPEFKTIEKPKEGETIDLMVERILNTYNTNEFLFREGKFNTKQLENFLISKGFKKYKKEI